MRVAHPMPGAVDQNVTAVLLRHWVVAAQAGAWLAYGRGATLAAACPATVGSAARELAEMGLVHLLQRRLANTEFLYLAQRSRRPAPPVMPGFRAAANLSLGERIIDLVEEIARIGGVLPQDSQIALALGVRRDQVRCAWPQLVRRSLVKVEQRPGGGRVAHITRLGIATGEPDA